ncbi:MAG: GIY-YIG nuclease family protein [Candidatus Firestonebacteria bacterium]|nr:GIY-YIG nuclease family protein [Candidatus Firestonebacteria bacterium]
MSNKDKFYYVYILTNKGNTVLYTGITNDIERRVFEHKEKLIKGFTEKYNIYKLVYYEIYEEVHMAIAREKQIKGGSRKDKINLVNRKNKEWRDLAEDFK